MNSQPSFYIYRIFNVLNDKSYIGQTVDYKARIRKHFYELRCGVHRNSRLQHAYDKYGRDAFKVEVLEVLTDKNDLNGREIYWVQYHDSRRNGYNLTLGGDYSGDAYWRPCTWNGVQYSSISEAARANGMDAANLRGHLKRGYTQDSDVQAPRPMKSVTWNGVMYNSITEAATAVGIHDSVMGRRIKKGWTCDADIPTVKLRAEKRVVIGCVIFGSCTEAAETLRVSRSVITAMIKRGEARLFKGN